MKQAGFTLFEVLISVGIFLLIGAAILMAVSVGVRTTTTLAQHRLHAERVDTLLTFFRDTFANLPACAEVSLRGHEVSDGFVVPELMLRNAPDAFAVADGRNGQGHVVSILAPSDGRGTLAIKGYSGSLSESERDRFIAEKGGWIRLLDGVQRIRWRFFASQSDTLVEEWHFGRPRLIELTLWITGEAPLMAQFWLPEVQTLQAAGGALQR